MFPWPCLRVRIEGLCLRYCGASPEAESAEWASKGNDDGKSGALHAKSWQAMVPLIGYVDRFSARPGERIAVKVSSSSDHPYRADLVRIIRADANPAGPGIKLEEIAADFAGAYVSRFQPVHLGSCGVVTPAEPS